MGRPAARVGDPVTIPVPPVLTATGSLNVVIGKFPAWRGASPEAVAKLMEVQKQAQIAIAKAEAATAAAAGTPASGAAKANEEKTKLEQKKNMADAIASLAAVTDVHAGRGVVKDGSLTVLINGLPACRQGDIVLEGLSITDPITGGFPTVLIGG